jgi:hypothetical protein
MTESERPAPNPGAAAALAFLDIVLCGWLAWFAVFFVTWGNEALLYRDMVFALWAPAFFAWFAYFPTDALTTVLARAVRIVAVCAMGACLVAVVESFATTAGGSASAALRTVTVGAICGYISGRLLAGLTGTLFLQNASRASCPRRRFSAWWVALYGLAVLAISFAVLCLSPFAMASAAGSHVAALAHHAMQHPASLAADVVLLIVAVASVPFIAPWLSGNGAPHPVPVAAALLISLAWGWLACRWGGYHSGFALLVYATALWVGALLVVKHRQRPRRAVSA